MDEKIEKEELTIFSRDKQIIMERKPISRFILNPTLYFL